MNHYAIVVKKPQPPLCRPLKRKIALFVNQVLRNKPPTASLKAPIQAEENWKHFKNATVLCYIIWKPKCYFEEM
jgi:hypothetical protein